MREVLFKRVLKREIKYLYTHLRLHLYQIGEHIFNHMKTLPKFHIYDMYRYCIVYIIYIYVCVSSQSENKCIR